MGDFSLDVSKFVEKAKDRAEIALRKLGFDIFERIVIRTPVDTGRARASWNLSINVVNKTVAEEAQGLLNDLAQIDQMTAAQKNKALANLYQFTLGDEIFISNNLVYINVLEDGGYPDPVQDGTYVKKGTSRQGVKGPGYIQLSEGGYSKQAPNGMVKVTVQEFSKWLNKAVGEAKRKRP